MKVLNVVLSILVLIMAGLSAASAYLLFEKRTQVLDGWQKLSTTINQGATALDKNSGTQVGRELSLEALAHSNYENLDSSLAKLKTQAEQLIKERDTMAESLRRIGNIVDMKTLPSDAELTEIASSAASCNAIVAEVNKFKSNRDDLVSNVVATASKLNVKIDANKLKSGNTKAEFATFAKRISDIQGQFNNYKNYTKQVGDLAGAKDLNFSDTTYVASLKKVVDASRQQKSQITKAISEKDDVNRKLVSAKNTITQRDGTITSLKEGISRKEYEISQYRKALGLETVTPYEPWAAGSEEARRQVVGKIIEINNKYGFVAVDLGSKSVVVQTLGKKQVEVDPQIASGMELQVARNIDTPDVKYIGKIKLVTVDNKCSTADKIELAPDQEFMVGDSVFFARTTPAKK